MRVLSTELVGKDGAQVECCGWVRSVREMGKMVFVVVADRQGKFQVVFKEPNVVEKAKKLGLEDVVVVRGKAKKDERVKEGGAEVEATDLEVLAIADRSLPVDIAGKTETNFEARFDHRVLDLRREKPQNLFRIQHTICQAFREYLSNEGFIEIHTPKIISTGTEGGANLFPVVYFDREAFLAQSPQFYKQMLVGAGFERVFELAPVFRAEEHDTPFHLNEYVSLDFEFGFIKDETDVMRHTAGSIAHIFTRLKEKNSRELAFFGIDLQVPKLPIPIVHYWELPEIFKKVGHDFPDPLGDLSREEEKKLYEYGKKEFGSDFLFVDNYPAAKRPAYTMPYEPDPKYTRGYDLLYKGLEIVTGGQRIHQYGLLQEKFREKGYDVDNFGFYFEVFKYGMPPHGGQAIGLERLTTRILELDNVREAAFFPRDKKRLTP